MSIENVVTICVALFVLIAPPLWRAIFGDPVKRVKEEVLSELDAYKELNDNRVQNMQKQVDRIERESESTSKQWHAIDKAVAVMAAAIEDKNRRHDG